MLDRGSTSPMGLNERVWAFYFLLQTYGWISIEFTGYSFLPVSLVQSVRELKEWHNILNSVLWNVTEKEWQLHDYCTEPLKIFFRNVWLANEIYTIWRWREEIIKWKFAPLLQLKWTVNALSFILLSFLVSLSSTCHDVHVYCMSIYPYNFILVTCTQIKRLY